MISKMHEWFHYIQIDKACPIILNTILWDVVINFLIFTVFFTFNKIFKYKDLDRNVETSIVVKLV